MDVTKVLYNDKEIKISSIPEDDFYKIINDELIDFVDTHSRIQYVNSYLFWNKKNLKSVDLPVCEVVGDEAFGTNYGTGRMSLSSVSLPNCTKIGNGAFGTTHLASIYAPNLKWLGQFALYQCSLTSVNFPNLEYIGSSGLNRNYSMTEINLPMLKSAGIAPFPNGITKAYLPKFTTLSTSQLYNNFGFGQALKEVYLPAMTSVPAAAFAGCTNLEKVNIENAISIGTSAFYNCSSLSSLYIPKCVHIAANAFQNCINLSNLIINRCEKISTAAFQNCSKLSSFTMYGDSWGLSLASSAFRNCSSLSIFKIITADSRIHLSAGVFANTPITNSEYLGYYGSIYVPTAFVEFLKSSTNWAAISDRITSLDNLPSNI